MVFEPLGERPAFPVALRALGERALPGGDRRCRRAGRGLADLHVNDGQALPLARIRDPVDFDRVERGDPAGGMVHRRPRLPQDCIRAREVLRRVDARARQLACIRDDDGESDGERAQLFEPFAPLDLDRAP